MVVFEAIRAAAQRLAATSDTARLDAELLMAHALGVNRSDMLLRHMKDDAPPGFYALVERRSGHEPVAYIVGVQEFYGRAFAVEPGVLIPRGDSEVLIDAALAIAPVAARVLDLGTGSGALLVTAMLEIESATGVGIDASAAALGVAQKNATQLLTNGEQAQFIERDWREEGWADGLGRFDLIVCNPPYVEDDAELGSNVRDFEPASALFAGPDGLDDYRIIIPELGRVLLDGGKAVLEIGHTQGKSVTEMAEKAGFRVKMRYDLANRPRALVLSSGNWE